MIKLQDILTEIMNTYEVEGIATLVYKQLIQ
jgi:hypothetical protein